MLATHFRVELCAEAAKMLLRQLWIMIPIQSAKCRAPDFSDWKVASSGNLSGG